VVIGAKRTATRLGEHPDAGCAGLVRDDYNNVWLKGNVSVLLGVLQR